jgi:SAM-dependent methyltransferase
MSKGLAAQPRIEAETAWSQHAEWVRVRCDDRRTPEQIREHYLLERQLAARLRQSTRAERKHLYGEVYRTLYSSLPHHPRHTRAAAPEELQRHVNGQLAMLRPFLDKQTNFLEIGCGDGSLLAAIAPHVGRALGLDVTHTPGRSITPAVRVTYDGQQMPFRSASVTLAYSNAVMEHLHVDDAADQLREIYRVLSPGGSYLLYTPHAAMGPGDVSKYFDELATGFHMKEYTFQELTEQLRAAGFRRIRALVQLRGRRRIPVWPLQWVEAVLSRVPYQRRSRLAWTPMGKRYLPIRLLATK